jgi:2-polyprenyl-3-methyl-5-hydroxy-6-metoxy-1,4-benzoquinol methylase
MFYHGSEQIIKHERSDSVHGDKLHIFHPRELMNTREQSELKFWAGRKWPFEQLYTKKYFDFYNIWNNKETSLQGNILDIGCGAVPVSLFAADQNSKIFLIDPLMDEYLKLEPNSYQTVYKAQHRSNKSSEELLYQNNYFDNILALNCLDHMSNECAIKTMEEIIRVLKKDGLENA